ncbi:MAG TPA: FkbM family methyltransferase, partial [Methanocorpusculum sp.]|nr:FkbM family methyltransferase [Methanocorpusculum sp.]
KVVPDFIKADIEGAERLMLSGAQKTLKEAAPKLSVCTYHFPDDKKVMKQLILQANQEYRIIDKWKKYYARI